ncbi:MAG: phosphatidate cytidylyltransferase [Clostridia bacterium]
MKERVSSALVCIILLLLILVVDNSIVDSIVVVIISLVGINEYNRAFKQAGYHPIPWIGYIGGLSLFLMGGFVSQESKMLILRIALPALIIMLFIYIIIRNMKVNVVDLAISVFSLIYIPFMFSFVKLILDLENGRFLIWLVLVGAFISDIFAFLIGSKFGKHKLCPSISPKKTVEGSIAGIIAVIISFVILSYVANAYFNLELNVFAMMLAGLFSSIAGQFGDLSASTIKRFCKIKDFGSIMPGHGGILDRCDSILFVAPVIYIFLKVYFNM